MRQRDRAPTIVTWEPDPPAKCQRKRCPVIAHVAPAGTRPLVIECPRCGHYERGEEAKHVATRWRAFLADRDDETD